MASGARSDFATALLRGLAEIGPVDPFSDDLTLELGLSLWLRRSATSLLEARSWLLDIRRVVLEVCALDSASEPVPLRGRSPRHDVVNLVVYLADLLRRGAAPTGLGVDAVAERVLAVLPESADQAVGA